jgi:hypothetical protein
MAYARRWERLLTSHPEMIFASDFCSFKGFGSGIGDSERMEGGLP